jgi:hypothetical protein
MDFDCSCMEFCYRIVFSRGITVIVERFSQMLRMHVRYIVPFKFTLQSSFTLVLEFQPHFYSYYFEWNKTTVPDKFVLLFTLKKVA